MKIKKIFIFIVYISLSSFVFAGIDVGDKPHVKLGKNGDGEKVNLQDHQGKVIIITFWATWCRPCMKELPVLSGIQQQVSTDKLQVIAISYEETKNRFKDISNALADNPIIFTYDRGTVARKYGVKAIPHIVIIGKDGIVKAKYVGYKEEQIPALIDKINLFLSKS